MWRPQNRSVLLILLIATLITSTSFAEVYDTKSLSDILAKFAPDATSLVVFDIDGTLVDKRVAPPSIEEWSKNAAEYLEKEGMLASTAEKVVSDYVTLHSGNVAFTPEETITVSSIDQLQKAGVTVIALTLEPPIVAVMTAYELKRIGIDFTHSTGPLQKNPFTTSDGIAFENGIIFNGFRHDKGTTMKAFMAANGVTPDKMIFIDNEIENINAMESAYAHDSLPHFSVHYTPHSNRNLKAKADCKTLLP